MPLVSLRIVSSDVARHIFRHGSQSLGRLVVEAEEVKVTRGAGK